MFPRLLVLALLWAITSPAAAEVRIAASLPSLGAVAREVVGDKGSVTVLASPNQDPHTIDGKPSLLLALNRADLLIEAGLDLEAGWLRTLITGSRNPKIQPGQPGHFVAADHAGPILEIPATVDRALGDVHPGGNPHFWYDPTRIAEVSLAIGNRLAVIDPANADVYRANAKRFATELAARTETWKQQMQVFRGRSIVPYHKSMAYMEEWLGLKELGTIEPLPGISPSPSHLAGLILKIRESQPKALVVTEPWHNLRTARTVAEKGGASLAVLPGEAGAVPGTDTYAAWMQAVLDSLKKGFENK